jgi:hypothetical protein
VRVRAHARGANTNVPGSLHIHTIRLKLDWSMGQRNKQREDRQGILLRNVEIVVPRRSSTELYSDVRVTHAFPQLIHHGIYVEVVRSIEADDSVSSEGVSFVSTADGDKTNVIYSKQLNSELCGHQDSVADPSMDIEARVPTW